MCEYLIFVFGVYLCWCVIDTYMKGASAVGVCVGIIYRAYTKSHLFVAIGHFSEPLLSVLIANY